MPFAIETMQVLAERGMRVPDRLYASSWGLPDAGLYGRLNLVDLASIDLMHEVRSMFEATGAPLLTELMEIVAGVLGHDLAVQRRYTYSIAAQGRLPCPVTVVAWTKDDIVPPGQMLDGWERCADGEYLELPGGHFAYFDWPSPLTGVLEERLTRADSQPRPG